MTGMVLRMHKNQEKWLICLTISKFVASKVDGFAQELGGKGSTVDIGFFRAAAFSDNCNFTS